MSTTPNARGTQSDDPDAAPWWRRAVVYQVYLRSFADANGDGTGDIAGLRSRLPYLADLGVDAIWLNPWYASPLRDGGYDVADFREIDPRFGSTAEAVELIAECHDHGIRVIVDIVPNHTSSEHEWFHAAVIAGPGSAERSRYHFLPGRGPGGSEPPTDWPSVFGGPAWTRLNDHPDDGEWYLHLFDPSQPDLNWDHPGVHAEFHDILRFWLDRGVDGFRVDVAHGLVKHPTYADLDDRPPHVQAATVHDHPFWDRDGLHDIYRSWRSVLDEYDDRMMVAEATIHASRYPLYLRPDEFHQAFDFDLLRAEWSAKDVGEIVHRAVATAASVGSNPTWVLSNHDVMRHATRFGLPHGVDLATWSVTGPHDLLDAGLGRRRARAAALVALALPGSTYLYQGDELALPEVWDLPPEVLDDPVWTRSGHTEKGRDGCRVPMPWSADGPSLGFGDGPPWLPQPASFAELSVESQTADPDSTLELYRRAIALRRELLVDDEQVAELDLGADVLAFERGAGLRSVTNMGASPIAMPTGELLLSSDPALAATAVELPPDVTVWVR